jgi:hypothetical protein
MINSFRLHHPFANSECNAGFEIAFDSIRRVDITGNANPSRVLLRLGIVSGAPKAPDFFIFKINDSLFQPFILPVSSQGALQKAEVHFFKVNHNVLPLSLPVFSYLQLPDLKMGASTAYHHRVAHKTPENYPLICISYLPCKREVRPR